MKLSLFQVVTRIASSPCLARGIVGMLLAVTLAGCNRDGVKVYQVTKDSGDSAAPPASALSAPAQPDASAMPQNGQAPQEQLQFALPPGWQQVPPSEMRVASFTVTNIAGPGADVGIIPLPSAGENELDLINMWREQVQLPPTNVANSAAITVGNDPAKLFEFTSAATVLDGKYKQRIMIVMLTRGTTSWFFKITGEDSFVTAQKDTFLQFLKTVSFTTATATAAPMAAAPPSTESTPSENNNSIWTVPAGWQSLPPSQFLLAQFAVQDGAARAEVNVSELAGQGGGLMRNVNRWRGQLGLSQLEQEEDFSKVVETLSVPGGQAQMVDMTGTDAKTGQPSRLVGVVIPRTNDTWFYKLMGDPRLVAAQKDAFIKFIQSAKYSDVR